MAGGVFHVEFGINETPLTRALENGNFVSAEKFIRENNVPSYLDEGCYQRTALYICLCGMDEEEERVRPRNLYLAKILVEHGANVNFRVPTINIQNDQGHTALFYCVIRGDVSACYKLLKHGADASIRGTVWETRKKKRKISPIFVSFMSIPVQRSLNWQNMHHKLARAPQHYGHLVDAGKSQL
ncbi:hypothetical protein KUTeg_007968 [Tegillarca granosa]|uniref:Uncharacterized protein n=1 Tax=Tegillarca granosa TaxID=220873 RepID=A0ABQ9FEQ5_TEGGR|nr:hypothetical protein KUTeg_007968 [Tegillarca granosa]